MFCLSRFGGDVTMKLVRELPKILFKSLVFLREIRWLSLVSLKGLFLAVHGPLTAFALLLSVGLSQLLAFE